MKAVEFLNESGLNRVFQSTQKHDFGMITAYRYATECGEGEIYSYAQKQQRNKSLLMKLRAARFSVTAIRGSYIENYGSNNAKEISENSFLVVDINDRGDLKEVLLKLGEEFEQDSILFGSAGGSGTLIGTNHCPNAYPGYHVEVPQGGAVFGKTGEFMSRVKDRPFVFSESVEYKHYGVVNTPTEIRSLVENSKKHWSEL